MASKVGRDDALTLALARGLSVRAAAKASGYSERQAHRKLDEPEFRRRVNETRGTIVGRAVGILTAAGIEAARTLQKLLKAESEQVRLTAAKGILELGTKLRESSELAERIEALEAADQQGAAAASPFTVNRRAAL